jgi:hypothetical protein
MRKRWRTYYLRQHRAIRRAKDIQAYRTRERVTKNAWAARNRGKVNATAARVRQNALDSEHFYCDICEMALQSQHVLDKHLGTETHRRCQVGNIPNTELCQNALNVKAARALAKANNAPTTVVSATHPSQMTGVSLATKRTNVTSTSPQPQARMTTNFISLNSPIFLPTLSQTQIDIQYGLNIKAIRTAAKSNHLYCHNVCDKSFVGNWVLTIRRESDISQREPPRFSPMELVEGLCNI